jgi:hypothetical protein
MAVSEKLRKKLQKKQEEIKKKSSGGGLGFFTIKEGTTRMRLLPVGEENEPGLEIKQVYLGQKIGGVILPSTFGLKCAITTKYEKLKASKDPGDREIAEKLKPKSKYMVLAIRYKDDKGLELDEQAGVKPLILSGGQYNEIIEYFLDDETGDMTDPLKGYDIKFKRSGKTMTDTEYSMVPCKPTKCPKSFRGPFDLEEEIKKIIPSYEETKDKLNEFLTGASGDEEDDEPAPIKKKKKKAKDL